MTVASPYADHAVTVASFASAASHLQLGALCLAHNRMLRGLQALQQASSCA